MRLSLTIKAIRSSLHISQYTAIVTILMILYSGLLKAQTFYVEGPAVLFTQSKMIVGPTALPNTDVSQLLSDDDYEAIITFASEGKLYVGVQPGLSIDPEFPSMILKSGQGNKTSSSGYKFTIEMLDNSKKWKASKLCILGNPQLSAANKRHLKSIYCDLSSADISTIANCYHLEEITITSSDNVRQLIQNQSYYKPYVGATPNFWGTLYDKKKLKSISIRLNDHVGLFESNNSLTFWDCPKDSLFFLPRLKSIQLDKITYLPIAFSSLSGIESFEVSGPQLPELQNLARVFHHFGKKTMDNDNNSFLHHIDTTSGFSIPHNGIYTSFYTNGQLLCKGTFLDGKPTGTWQFWYEDGKLAQSREYDNGKRVGEWCFFKESKGKLLPDTLYMLTFDSDQLIKQRLVDRGEDYYNSSGDNTRNGIPQRITTRICQLTKQRVNDTLVFTRTITSIHSDSLLRLSDFELRHKPARDTIGDTLRYSIEKWIFTPKDWRYSNVFSCAACSESWTIEQSGSKNGVTTHSSIRIDYWGNPNHRLFFTQLFSTDLIQGQSERTDFRLNEKGIMTVDKHEIMEFVKLLISK